MPAESYTPDPALLELVAEAVAREWGYDSLAETGSVDDGEFTRVCDTAHAVLAALATEPDLWQYGMPDLDEGPDAVMTFEGKPRIITPRMVRRPLRAVGPWLPVPMEGEPS